MTESERPALFQDRYELGPILGRGGTCSVYRAWDTRLHRHVAIKMLEPPLSDDAHARTRFEREGRAIARLSHPGLVTLIDRGTTADTLYIVFEYVEGRSLKDLIRQTGPLAIADAGQIAGQLAEGLAHAHLNGIVHRDVKPQNVLLDAEGRAKLTDFGIATGPDWTHVTRAGSIVGSSRYMSPEQVQSRPVDHRSDIYSLGVVLYEMLSGHPPFDGESITEIGRKHVREEPPPLRQERPEVAHGLERVVMRCLEKMPETRFQSMDELVGALVGLDMYHPERTTGRLLDTFLPGRSRDDTLGGSGEWTPPAESEVPVPAGTRRTARSRRQRTIEKRRAGAFIGGLVAVALVVAAVYALFSGPGEAPELVGSTLEEARAAAREAGMTVEVSESVPSLTEPAGIILDQSPAGGSPAPDGVVLVTAAREPIPIEPDVLEDYDPQGDASERPDLVAHVSDGDPQTSWETEAYKPGAFSELKEGVGIRFTLPQAATLVEVLSPHEGWQGVLRRGTPEAGFQDVVSLTGDTEQIIAPSEALEAGLIWITQPVPVAEEDGNELARISEIYFYR